MVHEPAHLHIYPLVCTAGVETEFEVAPAGDEDVLPAGQFRCVLQHKARSAAPVELEATRCDDGRVRFRCTVEHAGEVSITLQFPGLRRHALGSVYAVDTDLSGLLPLRGDFHSHTWHSDGVSSPRELLEEGWRLGLDFLAVTDHDNWNGSREAVRLGMNLPITVIPGEEVTFDRGHLVAVGIRSGVAEHRSVSDYEAEVNTIAAEVDESGEGPGFAQAYARGLWASRAIRALGGLAILAHPYWVAGGELHLDERLARRLFLDAEIDAVELLGDVDFEDNMRSIALHTEMAAQGARVPVVSNSDTHGLKHTLGRYWTVVFAETNEPEAILRAVRQGRCVACVHLPGEQLRVYGPLPLVHYAYFLHRRYFPGQDRLHEQGDSLGPISAYRSRCLGTAVSR